MFAYPLAATQIPPGVRKVLANLSGHVDFTPSIQSENYPALERIVRQTDAIGIGAAEAFLPAVERGELAQLQWRNLPQNLDHMFARCGIVSRTGFRLSPAARAMIETLIEVDRGEEIKAVG
ncbi:hypothetical protein D9M70_349050 [compost metagenome]